MRPCKVCEKLVLMDVEFGMGFWRFKAAEENSLIPPRFVRDTLDRARTSLYYNIMLWNGVSHPCTGTLRDGCK